MDRVVIKAMQQRPELRYQNTTEMKTDVDSVRAALPRFVRGKSPRLQVAAVLVGAVAIIGSIALFGPWKRQPEKQQSEAPAANVSVVSPSNPIASNTARSTVEWLLDVSETGRGGGVMVRMVDRGNEIQILARSPIPAGEWEITDLSLDRLQPSKDLPPLREEEFIFHTSGLKKLRRLFVRSAALGDAAFAFLANNQELD